MLRRLEAEYRELINETAAIKKRPMVALLREWSQIQREVQDMAEAGGFDPDDGDEMLDRLFALIDGHLSRLGDEWEEERS